MECIASIKIDEEGSDCLKKCTGLLVTTFDKHEVPAESRDFVKTLSSEYWKYKQFYSFPKSLKSKEKEVM